MANLPVDRWESGEAYERFIGRWSALIARDVLRWLGVPEGREWLDVGCGTGALSRTLLAETAPKRVVGVDSSAGYVEEARRRTASPVASYEIGDPRDLPLVSRSFDSVVS